jgi:hypothetical protein
MWEQPSLPVHFNFPPGSPNHEQRNPSGTTHQWHSFPSFPTNSSPFCSELCAHYAIAPGSQSAQHTYSFQKHTSNGTQRGSDRHSHTLLQLSATFELQQLGPSTAHTATATMPSVHRHTHIHTHSCHQCCNAFCSLSRGEGTWPTHIG